MKKLNAIMNRPSSVLILWAIMLVGGLIVVFTFDGTGDSGDSITHYQFARYAFDHPENFLNSWAKPVFVIFAAPFAQMGFAGMKIFNLLVALTTAYILYRLLLKDGNPFSWLALPFLFASPLFFVLIFSGLTEYFFALFWMSGIWLLEQKKYTVGALLLSFLPFVRAEGLVLLLFALLFLAFRRQWISIPLLAAGHIVFGVVGWIVHGDFFWTFTANAYASYGSEYGTGPWTHFLSQLTYVIGIPLYLLLIVGLVIIVIRNVYQMQADMGDSMHVKIFLIVLPLFAFILFHTGSYSLGLFHSMGLKRVLIAVVPLMIYIVIDSLGFISKITEKWPYSLGACLVTILVVMVLIFPVTSGPAAVKRSELMASDLQKQAVSFSGELQERFVLGDFDKIYCSQPLLQLQLGLNPFDHVKTEKVRDFSPASANHPLVIWDCEFCESEDGVSSDALLHNQKLQQIWQYPGTDSPCYLVFVEKR